MHEIFNSPKGNWEAIYINYKPDGLLKTSFQADDELGKPTWQSPLIPVAGRGGNMRTSLGRMGRTDGKDNGATGSESSFARHATRRSVRDDLGTQSALLPFPTPFR